MIGDDDDDGECDGDDDGDGDGDDDGDGGGDDDGDYGGDDVLVPTFRVARHSLKEEKNGCEEIKTTEVSDWFLGSFFVLTISSIENLLFISATRKHQIKVERKGKMSLGKGDKA